MRSATELDSADPYGQPHLRVRLERWNRRLHYYAGLFLLVFMWLFAVTGLVLNHPTWSFAESWSKRRETNLEHTIAPLRPGLKGDLAQAQEIMRQVGIEGEILWTTTRADAALFDFQVRRPGHYYFLKADLAQNRVTVRHSEVNLWGVAKVLHVFSGVSLDDPRQSRDWRLTSLWAFSLDAVAAGLIFMVLSSLYMWWERPEKRLAGALVLGLGTLICGFFCFGLRWLF